MKYFAMVVLFLFGLPGHGEKRSPPPAIPKEAETQLGPAPEEVPEADCIGTFNAAGALTMKCDKKDEGSKTTERVPATN